MIRALYSAASGMTAQQTNVDNIANNLANANTTGFKTRRAQFQDLMYQNHGAAGRGRRASRPPFPPACNSASEPRSASNEIIFSQGDFAATGNPLDVVIQGNGFFQIRHQHRRVGLYPRRQLSV